MYANVYVNVPSLSLSPGEQYFTVEDYEVFALIKWPLNPTQPRPKWTLTPATLSPAVSNPVSIISALPSLPKLPSDAKLTHVSILVSNPLLSQSSSQKYYLQMGTFISKEQKEVITKALFIYWIIEFQAKKSKTSFMTLQIQDTIEITSE